MSRLIALIALCCLPVLTPATESAREHQRPSAEAIVFDGLFTRPMAVLGTIVGAGLFVATLPFSVIGGNVDEAGEALVVEPARSAFDRCLGCPQSRSAFGM